MDSAQSPLDIAVGILGLLLAIPTLVAAVKLIYFVAKADAKLDACVDGMAELKSSLGAFKHDMRNNVAEIDTRVSLVERDVEQLQKGAA